MLPELGFRVERDRPHLVWYVVHEDGSRRIATHEERVLWERLELVTQAPDPLPSGLDLLKPDLAKLLAAPTGKPLLLAREWASYG